MARISAHFEQGGPVKDLIFLLKGLDPDQPVQIRSKRDWVIVEAEISDTEYFTSLQHEFGFQP